MFLSPQLCYVLHQPDLTQHESAQGIKALRCTEPASKYVCKLLT